MQLSIKTQRKGRHFHQIVAHSNKQKQLYIHIKSQPGQISYLFTILTKEATLSSL